MKISPFVFLALIFIVSCNSSNEFNRSAETEMIMKLHEQQRDHHFNKDSVAFSDQLSKNFISVNRGKISRPAREETIAKYNSYFSSVDFVKWDDVTDPIIRFSDDGTMAFTIVDKMIVVTYSDDGGNELKDTTHFAWTAIYKKYTEGWKIDCVTSTEKSK